MKKKNNKKAKVSVIYVLYKQLEELLESVESLESSKIDTSYEIIVVDNQGKRDNKKRIKKEFPEVKYIKSENIGYGAGNNLGADNAKGEYLFILNPDTIVKENVVDDLASFLERNKDTGIVAPNLLTSKGYMFEKMGSRELTPFRAVFALSLIDKLWPNNPISQNYYLFDEPKSEKREVGAVPGSAFMIRRKLFTKLGGFDEKMFLFFEEKDLGKRVSEAGYRSYIIPDAEVVHKHKSSKRSKKLKKDFRQSRYYYFKKHFGTAKAIITEALLRIDKYDLLFLVVFLLAAFLRFYRREQLLFIHSELGHVYLEIKNHLTQGRIPLVGPASSHPWLRFGPIYYWLVGPVLAIFDYDPLPASYFMGAAGLSVVLLTYIYLNKLVNKKTGLLAAYLTAISPSFIHMGRGSMLFGLVLVVFYPLLFYLISSLKKSRKYLFLTGILFGVMLNFHLSSLILIPGIVVLYLWKRKSIKVRDAVFGVLGMIIPYTTVFIYDVMNGFEMIPKMLLWIPYRVAGFLGLYPKNTVDQTVIGNNVSSLYHYFTDIIVVENKYAEMMVFLLMLLALVLFIYRQVNSAKKDLFIITVLILLAAGYLALFVHGNPPPHYYLPIFPIPIILLSMFLTRIWKYGHKTVVIGVLIMISVVNFNYFFSEKWFYQESGFARQTAIVKSILEDAHGRPFELQRVGALDQYKTDFAEDYQYLLWWKGNEPVKVGDLVVDPDREPELKYTIIEDRSKTEQIEGQDLMESGDTVVIKEDI